MKLLSKEELKIAVAAFLTSSLVCAAQFPAHECGHYVGGWLVGARDLEMDYFSVKTDQIEKFAMYKRVIFTLGGLSVTHLIIIAGLSLSENSENKSLTARLVGSSMTINAIKAPLGMLSVYYTLLIQKKKLPGKSDVDEIMLAKKLKLSPLLVWLVESLLDVILLRRGLRYLPGHKISTFISCFCGYIFGTIVYMSVVGPVILPDSDFKQKKD